MWKWNAIYLTLSKQFNTGYITPTLSSKQLSMSPDDKTLQNCQSSSCLVVSVDKSRCQSTPDTPTLTDNTTFILDCMGLRSAKIRIHTLVGTELCPPFPLHPPSLGYPRRHKINPLFLRQSSHPSNHQPYLQTIRHAAADTMCLPSISDHITSPGMPVSRVK